MALRVAGDPDLLQRVTQLRHRGKKRSRPGELAGRLGRVACDDEHLSYSHPRDLGQQLPQVGAVPYEPRGQVGNDREAVPGEALGKVEGRLDPFAGRGGDGELHLARDVLEHGVLDPVERDHLVARPGQELREACLRAPVRGDPSLSRRATPPRRLRARPPASGCPPRR
jgi:hypothetical protein